MDASYSIQSSLPGEATAEIATRAVIALVPRLQTFTVKVAVVAVGTVYTVVLVVAVGLDCPKIPVAIVGSQ
jgi:hypothetical protein